MLSEDELKLLSSICDLLQHFKILTKLFQTDSEVTLSLVLPKIHYLQTTSLQDTASDPPAILALKKQLCTSVQKRFGSIFTSVTLPALVSALDPRW
jgi:hypothetical protein